METSLVKANGNGNKPVLTGELGEIQSLAQVFMSSGLFADTKSISQAMVKIMAGRELGLQPFAAMRDINIIQGKTTLAGAQIAARIKTSNDYDFNVLKYDDTGCTLQFTKNGKALTPNVEFTMQHAKQLGLAGKDNYAKQARTMLYWRAVTMGARMFCPHIFNGPIYTSDELRISEPVDAVTVVPVNELGNEAPSPAPLQLEEPKDTKALNAKLSAKKSPAVVASEEDDAQAYFAQVAEEDDDRHFV